MKNITDYISKTVAFKLEYEKLENLRQQNQNYDAIEELKKKQFSAMVAFQDFDDLMACRAILHIMYPQDRKIASFVDNLINESNTLAPKKMTAVIDSYIDTVSVLVKEVKKRENWYNEFAEDKGLIKFNEFVKNGREIIKKGNEQSRDANIISGSQINPDLINQEEVSKPEENEQKVQTVSKISDEELRRAKEELQAQEAQKHQLAEAARMREEKRILEYEASLERRRQVESQSAKQQMEAALSRRKNN